jgi:hypothetical protein
MAVELDIGDKEYDEKSKKYLKELNSEYKKIFEKAFSDIFCEQIERKKREEKNEI